MNVEQELDELTALASQIVARAKAMKTAKADAPPALPPQWRHVSPPCFDYPSADDRWMNPITGTVSEGRGANKGWIVQPAQPRPANLNDGDITWSAGEWKKVEGGSPFFTASGKLVIRDGSEPCDDIFGGWRWTAVKVQPEVRRWTQMLKVQNPSGHTWQVAVPVKEVDDNVTLDTAAIAREEVIAELERMQRRLIDDGWMDASIMLTNRLAELRKEQP